VRGERKESSLGLGACRPSSENWGRGAGVGLVAGNFSRPTTNPSHPPATPRVASSIALNAIHSNRRWQFNVAWIGIIASPSSHPACDPLQPLNLFLAAIKSIRDTFAGALSRQIAFAIAAEASRASDHAASASPRPRSRDFIIRYSCLRAVSRNSAFVAPFRS